MKVGLDVWTSFFSAYFQATLLPDLNQAIHCSLNLVLCVVFSPANTLPHLKLEGILNFIFPVNNHHILENPEQFKCFVDGSSEIFCIISSTSFSDMLHINLLETWPNRFSIYKTVHCAGITHIWKMQNSLYCYLKHDVPYLFDNVDLYAKLKDGKSHRQQNLNHHAHFVHSCRSSKEQ